MKMGTAARILRWGLMVAVVVILVYPVLSMSSEDRHSIGQIGIDAEYDLEGMDVGDLAENLRYAYDNGAVSVVYGDRSVQIDYNGTDGIAEMLKASGARYARAVDANGDTVRQNTISYSDQIGTHIRTGVQIPGDLNGRITPGVSIVMSCEGIEMRLPAKVDAEGDTVRIDITVPYLIQAVASALGCKATLEIDIGLKYLMMFTVGTDMGDMPKAGFSHESGMAVSKDRLTLDGSVVGGTGGFGQVTYTAVDTGNGAVIEISSVGKDSPSATLEGDRNGDGGLDLTIGDITYSMDRDLADALIKSLARLEAM